LGYQALVYPVLLRILAEVRRLPEPCLDSSFTPHVSVIVTCAGEFSCVEPRLLDLIAQSYRDLEVVLVFDGVVPPGSLSARLATIHPSPIVECLPTPRGKTVAQNAGVTLARGEILVFTDISTRFAPGALAALVAPLADRRVVATCGELVYSTPGTEGVYWALERKLKLWESRFCGVLGANGAIYALRRDQYVPLPAHGLADLVEPLLVGFLHGGHCVYVSGAKAFEPLSSSRKTLLSAKRRITLRALSALPVLMPCLDAMRRPGPALAFVSHKILRWFSWLFVALLLAGLACGSSLTRGTLLAMAGILALALALPGWRLADAASYGAMVLLAQARAFMDFIAGRRVVCWRPTHLADE
jgi:hypothetical protein